MTNNEHTPAKEVNKSKYDYLRDMDTERLKALLQQESFLSSDENYDAELIQQIMNILEEREPILADLDVEASLKAFKADVVSSINVNGSNINDCSNAEQPSHTIKRRTGRSFRYVLIAAVLATLLGSTVIAGAFGINFWEYVINWGKETFQIGEGAVVTSGPEVIESSEGDTTIDMGETNSYLSSKEAFDAFGISVMLPSWIPDGFEFIAGDFSENPLSKSINMLYQCGDRVIMINVVTYESGDDAVYSFEKNENSGETVTVNGIEHYLMENVEQYQAVWMDGDSVCSINGTISKEEITRMIKSIYEEEL